MKMKSFLILLLLLMTLAGCSTENVSDKASEVIDEKINQTKQEITNQVTKSVDEAVDSKVNSIKNSVESTIDPKLGEIRTNMNNVKETALTYYSNNQRLPQPVKIESFFEKSLSDMNIKYEIKDNNIALVSYIGDKYSKEKVPDIIIDVKAQR